MTQAPPLQPLDGEPTIPSLAPPPAQGHIKRAAAVVALVLSLLLVGGFVAYRFVVSRSTAKPPPAASAAPVPQKIQFEAAASAAGSTLATTAAPRAAAPGAPTQPRVPSIEGEPSAAIPLRSDAGGPARSTAATAVARGDESPFSSDRTGRVDEPSTPRDMKNEAQANLRRYESQVGGMVAQLKALADKATSGGADASATAPAPNTEAGGSPLFGALERSATATVSAKVLGNRSLIIPKGVLFACSLKTAVVTSSSGFVACQTQRNVWSEDGKVVLAERGSHLDGEYRIVQLKPGMVRIPVLWTRLRTPNGVTIDLDSPATGALGESGIGGHVDNRWPERIGAALLVSLINDAVKIVSNDGDSAQSGNATVLLPSTADTGSKLAERVLAATINIPPLIYQNQGEVVGVYVARDLDFSGVYSLVPR